MPSGNDLVVAVDLSPCLLLEYAPERSVKANLGKEWGVCGAPWLHNNIVVQCYDCRNSSNPDIKSIDVWNIWIFDDQGVIVNKVRPLDGDGGYSSLVVAVSDSSLPNVSVGVAFIEYLASWAEITDSHPRIGKIAAECVTCVGAGPL